MVRIFTACHGTQVLVIQHLRRHLPSPATNDYLLWHPMDNNPRIDSFMKDVISTADFADTLDMRDFESLKPRTQNPVTWWFESVRRLCSDADTLHSWMAENGIDEDNIELWADDPIHFNVVFLRGLLKRASHVKIPHCFNHEDCTIPEWKENLQARWASSSWSKEFLFLPWQRWTSGVDMRMGRIVYDSAYTFALTSPWSANSVDISPLISVDAFAATYGGLPSAMRAEVDAILDPIRTSSKPLILLLLFGLGGDDSLRTIYQRAMARIFSERALELQNCTVAVKLHPGAGGEQEKILIQWLRANVPAPIHEIRHPLNLEFMLPQLHPDYVVAGLCGGLPIVRDLRAGQPVMLGEMLDFCIAVSSLQRHTAMQFLQGIEIW